MFSADPSLLEEVVDPFVSFEDRSWVEELVGPVVPREGEVRPRSPWHPLDLAFLGRVERLLEVEGPYRSVCLALRGLEGGHFEISEEEARALLRGAGPHRVEFCVVRHCLLDESWQEWLPA